MKKTIREELKNTWGHISAVALNPLNKRYEGVPCEWKDFDEFYRCNYQRYYKAKKKWAKYVNLTNENNSDRKCVFTRKVKEKGFTKTNTVFTSLSDRMKYHRTSRKIVYNDTILGTRDIINILKKRNIKISNTAVIVDRINKGTNIFKTNRLDLKYNWKGKYMSLSEISKKEDISKGFLKNKIYTDKISLEKAVKHCKSYNRKKSLFEGEMLTDIEIIRLIAKRLELSEKTILNRFYKNKGDFNKIIYKTSTNDCAPYRKKVKAVKGDNILLFNSVSEACMSLDIRRPSANSYLKGRLKNTNQTKGYVLTYA